MYFEFAKIKLIMHAEFARVKASIIKPLRGLICNFALLPTAAILLCKTAKLHLRGRQGEAAAERAVVNDSPMGCQSRE